MSHYDKLASIARDYGLEPIVITDGPTTSFAKLVAIVAAHIEQTNAALADMAQLTQRKPGRPRKQ